jgi:PAS domain S-box-containing protein
VEIDSALAVQDAAVSTAVADVAVERFDLGTYIGAKVVVDDETHGTVCFAAEDERETEFTDAESYVVELLARLVGRAIERRNYERELDEREAQLDERREIYRAVIDASFDLVFRTDSDGRFTYISPPVEDLLGYRSEEYVGHRFTAMLPDEETSQQAQALFERVMAGETVEEQYLPLEHATGDRVYVDVRVTPIYGSDGVTGDRRPEDRGPEDSQVDDRGPDDRQPEDIVGAHGMARDATDRYRRERLIRVLNRVLRHNLRNDVTVISGVAEELRERLTGEEAALATRIVDTSEQLIGLTETARKLEQNAEASPDLEASDVVPVVSRVAAQIAERHPDASITVDAPDRAVARMAPSLETAVWELLDNAAKHAGDRPTVDVSVTTEGDHVVVRVADDGPGLPANERTVLVSGEETPLEHGNGLGLWLVYWIVESCDGNLRVGDDDDGARIEICLRASSV